MKTVLITGASRGIGKAVANLLKDEWQVIAPGREEVDLGSFDSIDEYFKKNLIEFDAVVNNAGINIIKQIHDITPEDMLSINQVNLDAPLRIIQHCLPSMQRKSQGKIVNISSIWGVRSKEYRTLYSATKFGLIGLTKSLARDLAKDKILVNAICPGFTNTELTAQSLSPEKLANIVEEIPLGRLAEPAEIAELVSFLISDRNTYLTGQALTIDGGFTA